MSLRFHFFVSDVDPGNEDFMCKRVGSRFCCLAPGMKRFSLDLLQAVKKRICIGSGVWGCAEFVITSKFFFDFVILSWGKQ